MTVVVRRHDPVLDALAAMTVVVPVKNEADNIEAFLASVPDPVDLIVVDASTDNTPALIEAARPHTTVIRSEARIAEARQLGADSCNSPWLIFTDADVVFADDYFHELATLDLGADVGGVCGPKLSFDDHERYYRWFSQAQAQLTRWGVPAASGSNMLISREALTACGGFDVELTVNEDTEVMFRVRRAGFRVEFVADLVVYARDHRRLERGRLRKTVHSVARSTLLYTGLMPGTLRNRDWGYWSS